MSSSSSALPPRAAGRPPPTRGSAAAHVVIHASARTSAGASASLATAAAAVEHGERAAEARDHDLGRVALLAALVGPFARRELALDIDLGALAHVLLCDLRQLLVEDDDTVPFGALLALAALAIAPRIRRGHRHVHHGSAILHGPHFGVAAEIADQDDFVDAARHGGLLRFPGAAGRGTYLTAAKLDLPALWATTDFGLCPPDRVNFAHAAPPTIHGLPSKPSPILPPHE